MEQESNLSNLKKELSTIAFLRLWEGFAFFPQEALLTYAYLPGLVNTRLGSFLEIVKYKF